MYSNAQSHYSRNQISQITKASSGKVVFFSFFGVGGCCQAAVNILTKAVMVTRKGLLGVDAAFMQLTLN